MAQNIHNIMKLAFVNQPRATIIPPVQDGSVEIGTFEVGRTLAKSCDVVLYAKKRRSQQKKEQYDRIRFIRFSVVFDYLMLKILRTLSRFRNPKKPIFSSNLYFLGFAIQIAIDSRRQRYDVVHIRNYSQFAPVIRAINRRVKIVLHMHCQWLTQLDKKMIEKRLNHVDRIVGCCNFITEKIKERFPQYSSRCRTIYNGVRFEHHTNEYEITGGDNNKKKRLLFVGRVSPEKGIHVLLSAFQRVVEHIPEAQLNIIGPKRQLHYDYLVGICTEDNILKLNSYYRGNSRRNYFMHLEKSIRPENAHRVNFEDFVPHSQVMKYYQASSIYIQPSFSEAFPLSILEAMASGLPVVASRVGGIPEAVEDNKTGFLVEPGDSKALAEAILRLLSDENLCRSMGEAARQRSLELFTWERIAEHIIEMDKDISY